MSRALKSSLESLKTWVFQSNSRVQKIANGQGTAGTRAAPAQSGNNDKKIGSRLDNGEAFTKNGKQYKRYKFQVNKGADDKTLKQLADKDSHKVWAQADMPIGDTDARKAVEQLFDDLEKDLKK
ncbi:hypothetical protein CC78DRAFT_620902 [Lojkania enalia]|uniref:Uncharacterized protein n=1 Tax=Lojkania enalia TaxID=147567 RepID=A0A9P4K3S0_9PLEO|nr:hypothetical protein CC78DRAFT_620902 [Didymosphaeria enalia]